MNPTPASSPSDPAAARPALAHRVAARARALPRSLVAAGVLSCATLGLLAHHATAADAPTPAASAAGAAPTGKPALTVALTQARTSTLPIKLAANGSVVAWQEAIVGAEANGLRVKELHAGVGDVVKRGQLLASFAAEGIQADVALARAALAEASANSAEAVANAERARAVQGSGALSAQQVNQYLTQEQTAKARVESAKAQLDAQQLRLQHTQVLAPDSGIISARLATVGSVLGAGTEMFRLIRQGRLEWRGEVTATELGRIQVGMPVLVTAPGGAQRAGRVRVVAPTVDAQTRNGLVYVDLMGQGATKQFPAGPPQGNSAPAGGSAAREAGSVGATFKPGMYARGEFELGSSGALTVAQSAVLVRDGFSFVARVSPQKRVSLVKVQTGRMLGDQIEVLAGLKPEDRVVASGAGFLSEGDLVHVVQASVTSGQQPVAVKPGTAAPVPAQGTSK